METVLSGPWFDAHLHLQNPRFGQEPLKLLDRIPGLEGCVVNAICPADWDAVLDLASRDSRVRPALGVHPWYVDAVEEGWEQRLDSLLAVHPQASVGEAGLDRWIEPHDLPAQREILDIQLSLARRHRRPVSLHCLKAWGAMVETLRAAGGLEHGFLMHSFGGSREVLHDLLDLNGRVSFSGYFAQPRKSNCWEMIRSVPGDRLLVETDAPDMLPPENRNRFPDFKGPSHESLNHPGNLISVYQWLAELRGEKLPAFVDQVAINYEGLFPWA